MSGLLTDSAPIESPVVVKPAKDCAHCGLAVPRGLLRSGDEHQFCCPGCRTAWTLIHSSGLEAWYRISTDRRPPADGTVNDTSPESFDAPGFLERYATVGDSGRHEITFSVEGIHCAACVWLIEKLDRVCPGVERSAVNWSRRTVTVWWSEPALRLSQIARGLQGLGYRVSPITPGREQVAEAGENRRHLVRLGVAGAAAGNNMLIVIAIYLGLFSTMEASHLWLLRLASCGVGLLSLLWPGRVFFQGALAAIRTRTPHMDLPVALGLGVGGIAGLVNTSLNRGEIYFDSLSMLVFLLLVGRYIQYRQQRRAADAIELLYRMTPAFAWKVVDGNAVQVPAELLQVEDRIEIRAGETVSADGSIESGSSTLDESILTGESVPVTRRPGEEVAAGTTNLGSPIRIRVTAAGETTRLGQILKLVQSAAQDRPKIVQWADRAGGWFVVVVIFLAVVTLAGWWWAGSDSAVDHAVALLIVACPCALALATPLTLSVALGRGAARGIMIKGGDVLARMARPGTIWLDKTGTLTSGRMRVVEWHGDRSLVPAVMSVQSHSTHPIAAAFRPEVMIAFACAEKNLPGAREVQQFTGQGIIGRVSDQTVAIGNEAMIETRVGLIETNWRSIADEIASRGSSPVFVAVDNEVRAVVGVGDAVREEAAGLVEKFRAASWKVGILSGDDQKVVDLVAVKIGIDSSMAFGRQSPEEKVRRVRESSVDGTVLMVGDGVNDSPALAAADVGVAVHSGAHASLQAAPVWLARNGIGEIAKLLDASRGTMRTIRRAVAASLVYNILAVGLAVAGWIHPLAAAALMPVSSLTVVALAVAGSSFSRIRDK